MRKYFIINILISVIFNSIIAQDTILLMESKINVKHNATETFYYGFTVGDDIVLRVEEINGYRWWYRWMFDNCCYLYICCSCNLY